MSKYCRALRLELRKRISFQLHMSLFVAVLFNGICTICFHFVYLNAFTNIDDPVYIKNTVSPCILDMNSI